MMGAIDVRKAEGDLPPSNRPDGGDDDEVPSLARIILVAQQKRKRALEQLGLATEIKDETNDVGSHVASKRASRLTANHQKTTTGDQPTKSLNSTTFDNALLLTEEDIKPKLLSLFANPGFAERLPLDSLGILRHLVGTDPSMRRFLNTNNVGRLEACMEGLTSLNDIPLVTLRSITVGFEPRLVLVAVNSAHPGIADLSPLAISDNNPSLHTKSETEPPELAEINALLATPSFREAVKQKTWEELHQLIYKPTAKKHLVTERFKHREGVEFREFCEWGLKAECAENTPQVESPCTKLHFRRIMKPHTDLDLGDCSYLNTCHRMEQCKYVHYELDEENVEVDIERPVPVLPVGNPLPAQWIQCDVRKFDFNVAGKFAVIMADPPWDIHMNLPYGTMTDDEMRAMPISRLQDDGFIFLWVTGRAMELGRECLAIWGYKRVDELVWVKIMQLQKLIRTGRTGHWLNHSKEHCLIGMKGNPLFHNPGIDGDVLVAEVRLLRLIPKVDITDLMRFKFLRCGKRVGNPMKSMVSLTVFHRGPAR
ncbi:N6-adenosine-methyltransferase 70 kDa subunit [Powellomyces hirtus]|nr:N6-adenosine-methyltransferase 70 kDa subunit [Powellomyces hirtus]